MPLEGTMKPESELSPPLSEAEWELVVELLERERADLPAEIHHTRTVAIRDDLKKRLDLVEQMIQRIRGTDE
jgi:hypothetical protein